MKSITLVSLCLLTSCVSATLPKAIALIAVSLGAAEYHARTIEKKENRGQTVRISKQQFDEYLKSQPVYYSTTRPRAL